MAGTFLEFEKPLLTVMIQTPNPETAKRRIRASLAEGIDAFGLQMESFPPEYHTPQFYGELIEEMKGCPVYVTNYRSGRNKGKTDAQLAEELLSYADLGGTLFDVMMDFFDPTPGEVTRNGDAVKKQTELIAALHAKGKEVLMSAHVLKFISAEEVLEIALEQQRRGADVVKIVTYANTAEEEIENLRIIALLKEKLTVPFLFLCGGKCTVLRRVGPKFGCCTYLCVYEHDEHTTHAQPLLSQAKAARDGIGL